MQKTIPLDELLDRATKAKNHVGLHSTAEKVLLFNHVVSELQRYVELHRSMYATNLRIRELTKAVGEALRKIEQNRFAAGPTVEQVEEFYNASSRLAATLAEARRIANDFEAKP